MQPLFWLKVIFVDRFTIAGGLTDAKSRPHFVMGTALSDFWSGYFYRPGGFMLLCLPCRFNCCG